jgi:hypothetical protein
MAPIDDADRFVWSLKRVDEAAASRAMRRSSLSSATSIPTSIADRAGQRSYIGLPPAVPSD